MYRRSAIVMLITGLFFCSIGALLVIISGNWENGSFIMVLSLVFLLWAYVGYKTGKQIESADSGTRQAERLQ